jgi:uncharacterized membrane protein (DUF485 family)
MSPFLFAFVLAVLWVAVTSLISWIATDPRCVTIQALPDYDNDSVQRSALGLILSTLISVVTVGFILPIAFHIDTTGATQWIHHVGVVSLGIFLAVALCLQIEIWMKIKRAANIESVRRSFRYWRAFTEYLPAPAALMILVSGMSRLYAKEGFSVGRGWIFALVLILSVMMSDGIFGYTYDIRRLLHAADVAVSRSQSVADFQQATRSRGRAIKLIAHSLSFPFVVVFPAFKISDSSSPASPVLHYLQLEGRAGWPQLWPSLVLFSVPFLLVAALNRFGRRVSALH